MSGSDAPLRFHHCRSETEVGLGGGLPFAVALVGAFVGHVAMAACRYVGFHALQHLFEMGYLSCYQWLGGFRFGQQLLVQRLVVAVVVNDIE